MLFFSLFDMIPPGRFVGILVLLLVLVIKQLYEVAGDGTSSYWAFNIGSANCKAFETGNGPTCRLSKLGNNSCHTAV